MIGRWDAEAMTKAVQSLGNLLDGRIATPYIFREVSSKGWFPGVNNAAVAGSCRRAHGQSDAFLLEIGEVLVAYALPWRRCIVGHTRYSNWTAFGRKQKLQTGGSEIHGGWVLSV
jgi:hypothetical protein